MKVLTNAMRGGMVLLMLLPSVLGAQEASNPISPDATTTVTLNLRGAVQTALKQNIDVQISTLNIAVEQKEKDVSRAALLPKANLESNVAIERFNLKAMFGLQLPDVPHSIGPFQSFHAGPSFQIPVFDLSLLQKYEASGHRVDASKRDAQTVREQIVLLTVSEYSAHMRAAADVTAAQSRLELAKHLLQQAQDLRSNGIATKVDVSRADVRVSEEQQRLVDAQTREQTTIFALKRILKGSDAIQLSFADQQEFFHTPALDVDQSVETALKQRSELLALSDSVEVARAEHRAAVGSTLPTLNVNGHWDEEGATLGHLVPGYRYELDFRVPVFTGGRFKAEREEAALRERQARLRLDDGKNRAIEQIRDGKAELQASLTQVDTAKKQVGLAKDDLALSQGRFQEGVTDNIEVIAGQDAVSRADDAYIAALYRYAVARANLARAVGASEAVYTRP